jgi:hypothetical protein
MDKDDALDYRVLYEKALAEVDRLRAALEQIADWAQAYPLEAFPEPDFVKARALLEAGGMTLDALSASSMRHVVTEVAAIACRALKG